MGNSERANYLLGRRRFSARKAGHPAVGKLSPIFVPPMGLLLCVSAAGTDALPRKRKTLFKGFSSGSLPDICDVSC